MQNTTSSWQGYAQQQQRSTSGQQQRYDDGAGAGGADYSQYGGNNNIYYNQAQYPRRTSNPKTGTPPTYARDSFPTSAPAQVSTHQVPQHQHQQQPQTATAAHPYGNYYQGGGGGGGAGGAGGGYYDPQYYMRQGSSQAPATPVMGDRPNEYSPGYNYDRAGYAQHQRQYYPQQWQQQQQQQQAWQGQYYPSHAQGQVPPGQGMGQGQGHGQGAGAAAQQGPAAVAAATTAAPAAAATGGAAAGGKKGKKEPKEKESLKRKETDDEEDKGGKKKKTKKEKEKPEKEEPKPQAKSHLHPPRQAQSAWQLFFTDELNKAKAIATANQGHSPGGSLLPIKLNVAQIAKEAGAAYAELGAEQKAYYAGKVQESKDQYAIELEKWQKTLTPEDIRLENAFRAQQRKDGKSRKGNLKDPNAPKKPLSAYFLFLKGIREDDALRARVWGEETETTKQSVLAAERWRGLSDEEKKPYLQQAENDKQEYEEARKLYESDAAAKARGEDVPTRNVADPTKSHVDPPASLKLKESNGAKGFDTFGFNDPLEGLDGLIPEPEGQWADLLADKKEFKDEFVNQV